MKKLVKWSILGIVLLPAGMCVGGSLTQFPAKTERDAENQARGQRIVIAIADFREANGRFPESLKDLRAASGPELPTLVKDQREFTYDVTSAGYSLEFRESSFGMFSGDRYHRYRSDTEVWDAYFP